jgi:uncharacterized phiE125 gp8 family phage protein
LLIQTLKPIRSADPSFEPVTLAEAKSHLRIAESNEDHHVDISRLVQLARESIESDTNYVVATGTYVVKMSDWPDDDFIVLPVRPVSSLTSVQYVDSAGATQTYSSSNYSLNLYKGLHRIQLAYSATWPTTRGHENDITVTFVAGYSTAAAVPAQIKQLALLKIEQLFDGDPKGLCERAYEWLLKKFARPTYP